MFKRIKIFFQERNKRLALELEQREFKLIGIVHSLTLAVVCERKVEKEYICSLLFYENGLGQRNVFSEGNMPTCEVHSHSYWHKYCIPWINHVGDTPAFIRKR